MICSAVVVPFRMLRYCAVNSRLSMLMILIGCVQSCLLLPLEGKYVDEKRWISREDFYKLKDTDPYVAIVWSFGNNMRDYLIVVNVSP